MCDLVPLLLLTIFYEFEYIDIGIFRICGGCNQFPEYVLCDNFGILLKVGTFFNIVF